MDRPGDCAQLVKARRLLERCEALISPQYTALLGDVRDFIGINARGERTTPSR
jgi:hypothetical protein